MRSTKQQASTGDKSPDFTSSSTVCFKTKLQKETNLVSVPNQNYESRKLHFFFQKSGVSHYLHKK